MNTVWCVNTTFIENKNLSNKDTSTTGSLNLLLSTTAEEASLDDDGLGEGNTLTKDLSVTSLESINDGDGITSGLSHGQAEKLVQIHNGAVMLVAGVVECTHTQLSKEPRMVTVKVGTVMSKTTSLTTTSGMLAMLSNTTVTGGDVATKLPGLFQSGNLEKD